MYVTELDDDDIIMSSDLGESTAIVGPAIWVRLTDSGSRQRTIQIYRNRDENSNNMLKAVITDSAGYQTVYGPYYMRDAFGNFVQGIGYDYAGWIDWLTINPYGPQLSTSEISDDLFKSNITYCEIREGITWNRTYRAEAVNRAIPLLSKVSDN